MHHVRKYVDYKRECCCCAGSTASPPVPSASECSVSSDHGGGLASPPEPSTALNGGRTPTRTTAEEAQAPLQQPPAKRAPSTSQSTTEGSGRIQGEPPSAAPLQSTQSDSSGSQNGTAIARVFVKAQPCPESVGGPGSPMTLSMEVGNLPQQGGETCNIEFSFNVGEDSVQAIIAEMQAELNLNLSEEEATIVHRKIDEELKRCVSSCTAIVWPGLGSPWNE